MSESTLRTRRWTRFEYDKLIDAGFLGPGDKIELLGGQLCISEPQNNPHAMAICPATDSQRFAWIVPSHSKQGLPIHGCIHVASSTK